jgi:hypothetical protein
LGQKGLLQNVADYSQRIQILEGNGIRTFVEDHGVAVVDKEHMGCARLDIRKKVLEELIWVRPPMEG